MPTVYDWRTCVPIDRQGMILIYAANARRIAGAEACSEAIRRGSRGHYALAARPSWGLRDIPVAPSHWHDSPF